MAAQLPDPLIRLQAALADRYRFDRELGQGGMATVYLAHDLKHDRDVALKVLRPELAAVLGRERFLAEIHLTAKLDRPHILTLPDSGEGDGCIWDVISLYQGRVAPPEARAVEAGYTAPDCEFMSEEVTSPHQLAAGPLGGFSGRHSSLLSFLFRKRSSRQARTRRATSSSRPG